jgi:hypothetical protein
MYNLWDCEVYDEDFKAKCVWLQMFSVGHLLKKKVDDACNATSSIYYMWHND